MHLKDCQRYSCAHSLNDNKQTITGFTLVELMVVIAIVSIIAFAGIPSVSYIQARSETFVVKHELSDMLFTTRSYALITNSEASFCGADNTGHCKRRQFDYFQIFIDSNKNKIRDQGEQLISLRKISLNGDLRLNAHTAIRFNNDGTSYTPASFIYCPKYPSRRLIQRVTISMAGRIVVAQPNSKGEMLSASKRPIKC